MVGYMKVLKFSARSCKFGVLQLSTFYEIEFFIKSKIVNCKETTTHYYISNYADNAEFFYKNTALNEDRCKINFLVLISRLWIQD